MRVLFVTDEEHGPVRLREIINDLQQQGRIPVTPSDQEVEWSAMKSHERFTGVCYSFRPHVVIDLTYNLTLAAHIMSVIHLSNNQLRNIVFCQLVDGQIIQNLEIHRYFSERIYYGKRWDDELEPEHYGYFTGRPMH